MGGYAIGVEADVDVGLGVGLLLAWLDALADGVLPGLGVVLSVDVYAQIRVLPGVGVGADHR